MSLGSAGVFPFGEQAWRGRWLRGGLCDLLRPQPRVGGVCAAAASLAPGTRSLLHLGRFLSPCRQLTDRLCGGPHVTEGRTDSPQIIKRPELAPPLSGALCRALVLLGSLMAELLAEKSGPQPHMLAATESACGCRGLQGGSGRWRQRSRSFPGSLRREGGD